MKQMPKIEKFMTPVLFAGKWVGVLDEVLKNNFKAFQN